MGKSERVSRRKKVKERSRIRNVGKRGERNQEKESKVCLQVLFIRATKGRSHSA